MICFVLFFLREGMKIVIFGDVLRFMSISFNKDD